VAYEAGSATSKEDFIDKLTTFLAANGWTKDEFSASLDQATVHLNDVYVHFEWDASTGGIRVNQSLDYSEGAVSAVVAAGGNGYTVGDDITLVGGTSTVAGVFNVDTVGGSNDVLTVSVVTRGNYTVKPGNPVTTSGGTGTGCTLTVSWAGVDGDEHPDSSGNGGAGTPITGTYRGLDDIGNGPYVGHWFFTSNEDGADYFYAVLEYSAGKFACVGAGEMVKFGTWTGGEWCGATSYAGSGGITDAGHCWMVDARCTQNALGATVHVESLPDQGSSKWGCVVDSASPGNDGDSNVREIMTGGSREGFLNYVLQGIRANPNSGFVPMIPYLMFYRSSTVVWRYLGKLPHVREINGYFLTAGEEFTLGGSETWKVFPYTSKASSGTPHSGNMFFAIRKIT
jgi:hypothetical protein